LYFKIALMNEDNKDKYYTNLIDLYNLWNARYVAKIGVENSSEIIERPRRYNGK
jgi:hypothetical protein